MIDLELGVTETPKMGPGLKDHHPLLHPVPDVMDHGLLLYDREGILAARLRPRRARLKELGTQKIVLEDGTWQWRLKPGREPGESIEL